MVVMLKFYLTFLHKYLGLLLNRPLVIAQFFKVTGSVDKRFSVLLGSALDPIAKKEL